MFNHLMCRDCTSPHYLGLYECTGCGVRFPSGHGVRITYRHGDIITGIKETCLNWQFCPVCATPTGLARDQATEQVYSAAQLQSFNQHCSLKERREPHARKEL